VRDFLYLFQDETEGRRGKNGLREKAMEEGADPAEQGVVILRIGGNLRGRFGWH
jgi:hypothetical protein